VNLKILEATNVKLLRTV